MWRLRCWAWWCCSSRMPRATTPRPRRRPSPSGTASLASDRSFQRGFAPTLARALARNVTLRGCQRDRGAGGEPPGEPSGHGFPTSSRPVRGAAYNRFVSPEFKLESEFALAGDQPQAVDRLTEGIVRGDRYQTLLGVTGTGKTFTMAHTIARVQKPTLVIAPNKSLAAQLANEFREVFPNNAVEYFVSYYDYYQPEAYVPQTDTYIEKDSSINDEIERLRHSATSRLLTRRDVIIVASVSCIYGLGSPEEYTGTILRVHRAVPLDQSWAVRRLVDIRYERNEVNLTRGKFRVRGDTLEVTPAYEQTTVRVEWWG